MVHRDGYAVHWRVLTTLWSLPPPFCNSLYSGISQSNLNKLQRIQNSLARRRTRHYKHFKISTHHINTKKNYTGFQSNKESITNSVFSHTKHKSITYCTYLYNSLSFPSHSVSTRSSDSLVLYIHSICQIITGQKGFLCHRSTTLEFTTSRYPKFKFFTNFPFQAQNTPLQNCIPSLGSFPSPWTVYPDFDSCYSHFMPYRMTPSVRHRAIEVHYYYYYYYFDAHKAIYCILLYTINRVIVHIYRVDSILRDLSYICMAF